MAGFELARIGGVADAAREWKVGRYIPLYLAGIAAGVGIGVGVTLFQGGDAAVQPHASAPVTSSVALPAPAVAAPVVAHTLHMKGAAPVLPAAFMHTWDAMVANVKESHVAPIAPAAVEPARPVANQAPAQAQAPAVPVAPAQPAAAPVIAPTNSGQANFYVPPVSSAGPTNLEQRLFDGINAERAKAGLAPYSYDAGLTKIARTRSQQMVDQNYFAHTDPYGYSMYVELLKYFGYDSYNWAGENLALNNYGLGETSERAVVALMNSPTHRANLLATDFYRVGIGEETTADGRHIFTMIFLG